MSLCALLIPSGGGENCSVESHNNEKNTECGIAPGWGVGGVKTCLDFSETNGKRPVEGAEVIKDGVTLLFPDHVFSPSLSVSRRQRW